MRSVIFGFGRIGNSIRHDAKIRKYFRYASHAQVLFDHPGFDWVGVVDPDPQARKAAEEWHVPFVSDHIMGEMEPEFAVLATPPGTRLDIVKDLPKLKAVLIEKPLGEEGEHLLNFCHRNGIKASINYWRRGCKGLRELDIGNRIGGIQAVFATYGNGLYNNGSHMVDFCLMLFGSPESVQRIGQFDKLGILGCSGPIQDYHASFALEYPTFNVMIHALDYRHYREFSLDIWGTHGRVSIVNESLMAHGYPRQDHRAMEKQREIADLPTNSGNIVVGDALYRLYTSIAAGESFSPATMEVQNILDEICC